MKFFRRVAIFRRYAIGFAVEGLQVTVRLRLSYDTVNAKLMKKFSNFAYEREIRPQGSSFPFRSPL
jgi:hypothetical protein